MFMEEASGRAIHLTGAPDGAIAGTWAVGGFILRHCEPASSDAGEAIQSGQHRSSPWIASSLRFSQ
jgi:hypothetical protein